MGSEDWETKSQLVRDICSFSTVFTCCPHLSSPSSARRPAFVDWYLILRVDEYSGLDVIRRRYRQLALQLHPDKNRHPKAEVAFKLISQAYECLSDRARRKAFNSSRRSNFCRECHLKFERRRNNPQSKRSNEEAAAAAAPHHTHKKQQHRALRAFREVQNRLREECRVVENCLRAKNAKVGNESPLFDPSDRLLSPGYPHRRHSAVGVREPATDHCWCYFGSPADHWSRRRFGCESPVYQLRSENKQGWRSYSPAGCSF